METKDPNDLRVASFSCYIKPMETSNKKFSAVTTVLDSEGLKPSWFKARTLSTALKASSWSNNRRSLLQRSTPQPKPHGQAFGVRWFKVCVSSCFTKKDVNVHQSVKKADQFAFPVLNDEKAEELPLMSLEEFASRNVGRFAIPNGKENKVSDDVGSEASSSLFEVENKSTTELWKPCIMSPCAPSEDSVDWSTNVTATEAGVSPVQSDYDEKDRVYNTTMIEPTQELQKKRSNGLLGCKISYISAKVAELVYGSTTNKSKQ